MYDVFISYSRKDADVVNKFVTRLEQEGVNVWIDRDGVDSGDEFKEVISQAIKDSSIVLFFSSRFANQSSWTAKEIGLAEKYNKYIIPILLDDSKFKGAVEFDLVNYDYVDCTNPLKRIDNMEKLVCSVKSKLSGYIEKNNKDVKSGSFSPRIKNVLKILLAAIVVSSVVVIVLLKGSKPMENNQPSPKPPSETPVELPQLKEPQSTPDLTITVKGVSFVMKYVEGGSFQMGATIEQGTIDPFDDEGPVHNVTVSTFHIGETEVTQALWKSVMGNEPLNKGGWSAQNGRGDFYPAYLVSWDDCQKFIEKLNKLTGKQFRLPTEAEWEFAARGGNKSGRFKYAGDNGAENVAWFKDNSNGKLHLVKSAKPNELDLYDMSGNVWEWCVDSYYKYNDGDMTNPNYKSNGKEKILRGGSWSSVAGGCRVSARFGDDLDSHELNYGFRLVLPQ